MVKTKSGFFQNFTVNTAGYLPWLLPLIALLTFISSWAGMYAPPIVEHRYAHGIFPKISSVAAGFADAVSFSWLDVVIPAGAGILIGLVRKRQWQALLNTTAALYLLFFWTWGLNYHRLPLASRLQLEAARMQPAGISELARQAAGQMNRLYRKRQGRAYDDERIRAEAVRRVGRVVEVIDGSVWRSAERIKTSFLANPWLHAAGIDGLFNPFGQEPVISSSLLDVEKPFVIAHELAHGRGYPDEGDANVIAVLATLMSADPDLQYSGWLSLWLYLRSHDLDTLLDAGPQRDIERIFQRVRTEEIHWITDFQQGLFDWFLKANSVDEGVRSYSRVVLLAAGSEPFWPRFQ
jgi:hypothetical protein